MIRYLGIVIAASNDMSILTAPPTLWLSCVSRKRKSWTCLHSEQTVLTIRIFLREETSDASSYMKIDTASSWLESAKDAAWGLLC